MEEYTREQIQRADDNDLYVYLSGRGEQYKHVETLMAEEV